VSQFEFSRIDDLGEASIMAHDKTSFICGASLRRSVLPGLSAGCQGFRRHDIGAMSCAHWRSTQEHLLEGTVWIYGFWTGLNYVAAASDQTQAKIDMGEIVAEVEKTCAQETSQTLASAVWTEPSVTGRCEYAGNALLIVLNLGADPISIGSDTMAFPGEILLSTYLGRSGETASAVWICATTKA
jgi:hypothetical protein